MKIQISKLDQKILLQKVSKLNAKDLFLCNYQPKLNFFQKVYLKYLHFQRKKGLPIAYLTNNKEFYGRDFYVDKNVLIPRPETEQIIELAKSLPKTPENILDIGTGSGCISITLLSEFPDAQATLLDISSKALKIARKNSSKHQTIDRSNFLKSDLLTSIQPNTTYDLIATNPPYIPMDEPTLVDPSTKKFEPSLALFSGIDGLDAYRDLFKQIEQKNITFHYLIGEFGFGQKPSLELLLKQYSNQYSYKFFNDLNNIPRIFLLTNKAWN